MSSHEFKNESLARKAKLFSWESLEGCFGNCSPGDLDGLACLGPTNFMERCAHVLFLENKCVGGELLESQRLAFIALARHLQHYFTLFVITHTDLSDQEVNGLDKLQSMYIVRSVNGRLIRTVEFPLDESTLKFWGHHWFLHSLGDPNSFEALFLHAAKRVPIGQCQDFAKSGLVDHPELERWMRNV